MGICTLSLVMRKIAIGCVLWVGMCPYAWAQFKRFAAAPSSFAAYTITTLRADVAQQYLLPSPVLANLPAFQNLPGETYWMGQVTTQSYNQGKLGTFYYWDLQGNLRETKFFIDVAGGKKRGLKIVIPRRIN